MAKISTGVAKQIVVHYRMVPSRPDLIPLIYHLAKSHRRKLTAPPAVSESGQADWSEKWLGTYFNGVMRELTFLET